MDADIVKLKVKTFIGQRLNMDGNYSIKKQEKNMSAWRRKEEPEVFSRCCNALPAWKEEHLCSKCCEPASFYDQNDTMTLEEYRREQMQNNDSKFDLDLKYGQIREELFADIMEGKELVEVKTERGKWKSTGNIAIEWESRGKLSGIATTKADWWAHFLADNDNTEAVIMMRVPELKSRIKKLKKIGVAQDTRGGDDDTSRLVLLPLKHLFGDV